MPSVPRICYIVSHTHWDREWYLSYHRFRVMLVDTVSLALDRLENEEEFRHFVLDGQAIVLEDYLEVRPEDGERVRRLVEEGALSVGPWYVLPDEFLVSGESLVRSLVIGHRVAGAFGPVQKVGYIPDSFGHVAQMPQILRGAGIGSFIYMRGNGDELDETGLEYLWRGPDGSEVLAVNQCGGYVNAAGLGYPEHWYALTTREIVPALAVEKVRAIFESMAARSNTDVWLLNNGSDHLPPQRDLTAVLAALREAFPETEFRHAGFDDFIDALRADDPELGTFTGELARGKYYHILSGVWSARMYLKQLNDTAQALLSNYVEPLSSYAHFILGGDYPNGQIGYAWKLLLKNHPHDSICGCSVDEVHDEMVPRFRGVNDTSDQILRRFLERIAPSFGETAEGDCETVISVANPLPFRRSEVVERIVILEPRCDPGEQLALVDERGTPVPFEVVDRKYLERFWGIDYRTQPFFGEQRDRLQDYLDLFADRIVREGDARKGADRFLTVRFLARDVPAVGHANYFLRTRGTDCAGAPAETGAGRSPGVVVDGDTIENEHYRVRLHGDGTFDVLERASGRTLEGLNRFEDTEDVGDEYDYSPCPRSETVTSDARSAGAVGAVRVLEGGGLAGEIEAEFALRLPASIAPDRSSRSSDRVACAARTRVRLVQGSKLIEVELHFDNRALDHRLRVEFPTAIESDSLVSDGHFYLNRRPITENVGEDWVQPPAGTRPQQGFSLVEDAERGFALFVRGLPEIEPTRGPGGDVTLSLTLLRAVGWLSRDDFPTRRFSNAGPTLHTPGAQCPGEHRFKYALALYEGDHLSARIPWLSQRYRTPLPSTQGVVQGLVPAGRGLVETRNGRALASAIKRHDERQTLVIRLWNPYSEPVEERLAFGLPVRAAWRTDLLEARREALPLSTGREAVVELGPHEILTLEVELGQRKTRGRAASTPPQPPRPSPFPSSQSSPDSIRQTPSHTARLARSLHCSLRKGVPRSPLEAASGLEGGLTNEGAGGPAAVPPARTGAVRGARAPELDAPPAASLIEQGSSPQKEE